MEIIAKKSKNQLKKGINQLLSFIEKGDRTPTSRALYLTDPSKDFTRKRKLSFSFIVLLIIRLLKKVYPQN